MNITTERKVDDLRLPDDQLWQAVLTRDQSLNGAFVYGVRSTMIYCRSTCSSRRPRRDRVSFFDNSEAAERAGFRACKRCRPDSDVAGHSEMIRRACEIIDKADELLTLTELSHQLGISSFHLQRTFKKALGISPRQYAATRRASKFREGVRQGQAITSALYDAGYGSSSRLYERSSAELGMTPATYGRNGRGATISYVVTPCELGSLLVAATTKGICAVRLGSSAELLEQQLEAEFSEASISADTGDLNSVVQEILDHLAGTRPDLKLPLDVQATAFQRQVWEALCSIPYGSTRSYSQVAASIGRSSAVRAVARACATNPVALVVPCHRVIGTDKSLSGYRWGLDRKKKLLEREAERGGEIN